MMNLKPRGLHEYVIEHVGQHIVAGEFAAGKALPGDAQLREMLGVSRMALREALRMLAAKGLVELKRKIGTQVCERERWNFLNPQILSRLPEGSESDQVVSEFYELRHLVRDTLRGHRHSLPMHPEGARGDCESRRHRGTCRYATAH